MRLAAAAGARGTAAGFSRCARVMRRKVAAARSKNVVVVQQQQQQLVVLLDHAIVSARAVWACCSHREQDDGRQP